MIYDRRMCARGSFLGVVPLGLVCTLQYSDKGILQTAWPNLDPSDTPDPDNILEQPLKTSITVALEKAKVIPQRIQLPSSGHTLIKGVLYTKNEFFRNGYLPEVVFEDMIKDVAENPSNYTFLAGDIRNSGLRFNGAIAIRNRLEVLGFKTIPGYSITEDFNDTTFVRMLKSNRYPYPIPLFAGYMVFLNGNMTFYAPQFRQFTVSSLETYPDKNGYIMANIYSDSGKLEGPVVKDQLGNFLSSKKATLVHECTISYTDVVKYNIQKGTSAIVDSSNNVVMSRPTDADSRKKISAEIKCSICGKSIKVMSKGYTQCDDPHCQSKMYPDLIHFCNTLSMEVLPFDKFSKYIHDKSLMCLTDIFTLDEYKDVKVKCTIGTLLTSIVPVSVCSDPSVLQEIVSRAGSPEAVDYYLKNPGTIEKDLKISSIHMPKIIRWLNDSYNISTYETLISMPEFIEITQVEQKFSGAPIFRNKVICITGKFKCGDYETVTSILKSYSAEVVTQFSNRVSAVLVGHFREEDPTIIQLAKSYGKPVYKETEFFNAYEISKDLQSAAK